MKERLREENTLENRFKQWGIRKVLFDVDATLTDTTLHYREKMFEYCDFLAEESGRNSEKLMGMFLAGIRSLREEFQVHPAVLQVPAMVLARMAGVDGKKQKERIEELMKIYEEEPGVFEGAVEQVEKVREAGVDTAAVTHSGKEWTFIKLREFRGKFEKAISTPVDKPKDERQWRRAMEELEVKPEEVMIVGDSIFSDIIPGLELGVGKLVWISGGREWGKMKWEGLPDEIVAKYKEKPGQVMVIERIDQLEERLLLEV